MPKDGSRLVSGKCQPDIKPKQPLVVEGVTICLTCFLLPPLAILANLIARGSGHTYSHFLADAAAGEATWLGLYGGLGYTCGSQWALVSQLMSDFSGVLVGIVILETGVCLLLFPQHRRWLTYFGHTCPRSEL